MRVVEHLYDYGRDVGVLETLEALVDELEIAVDADELTRLFRHSNRERLVPQAERRPRAGPAAALEPRRPRICTASPSSSGRRQVSPPAPSSSPIRDVLVGEVVQGVHAHVAASRLTASTGHGRRHRGVVLAARAPGETSCSSIARCSAVRLRTSRMGVSVIPACT